MSRARNIAVVPALTSAQVFTSSGTFTVPANVTRIKVTVVGGGGGGSSNGNVQGRNGGGAGGTAIKWISGLTPGQQISVTVGLGGAGVNASTAGAGGTSSFGAYCSATGGNGGTAADPSSGYGYAVPGGVGSGGDINLYGGRGGGTSPMSQDVGGYGGATIFGGAGSGGGGGGGAYSGASFNSDGSAPGAGGGGTARLNASQGGNGANGIVIVEY